MLFFLRNALYSLVALYSREVLGAGGQAARVRIVSRPLPYEYLNHHATAFEPLLGLPPLVKC